MPITFNGLGTAVCPARGFVSWATDKSRQADCDAVECFVVLFLPVVPFEPIHAFGWNRNQYQKVPLRWSIDIVVCAFLRRWLWVPLVYAVARLPIEVFTSNGTNWNEITPSLIWCVVSCLGFWCLALWETRPIVPGRH